MPPLNLLNGYAKFVSMSLFLVWQDRALSVYIKDVVCCIPGLRLVLRSEIPSGMCAKLRTVAASNSRDHARNLSFRTLVVTFNRSHINIGRATTSQSLLLLLVCATYIMVLFFTHIPFLLVLFFNFFILLKIF